MNEEVFRPPGFDGLTPEQRELLVGVDSDDVLGGAFPRKRVVHPGVRGTMLAPGRWAKEWELLLGRAGSPRKRTAYIHIPFCQARCLYCGFFQNFSCRELEDAYLDRLVADLEAGGSAGYAAAQPIQDRKSVV